MGRIDVPRFKAMAAALKQEASDIYCFQEVFSETAAQIMSDELSDEYEFCWIRPHWCRRLLLQVANVSLLSVGATLSLTTLRLLRPLLQLPQWGIWTTSIVSMASLLCWTRATVLWSFLFNGPAGGVMTAYRRDVAHASVVGFHAFEEQRGDFLNFARARGYLRTSFDIHGACLTVLNAHANAFPSVSLRDARPTASSERKAQLRHVFADAADIGRSGEPLVVLGDFNSEPDLREIPAAEYGFQDMPIENNSGITAPLTPVLRQVFPDTPAGMRLDYQFSKGLRILKTTALEFGQLSDHLPLKVEYAFA